MDIKGALSKIFSLRNLFLWGNVLLLGLFLIVLVKDDRRGWKPYQQEFRRREIERAQGMLASATTDADRDAAMREIKAAKGIKVEIRQLWTEQLNSVDRCITCHTGYDPLQNTNLSTTYKDAPFSAPADSVGHDIHKIHDLEKFGCVVCHGGQGLATEVDAAHGHVAHWETPLMEGTLMQASCAKCHDNLNELVVHGQVYPSEILRAKKLFRENGCIGCHQIGGEGGPISVDLKEETSAKPLSRIDFAYSGLPHEKWVLSNWIKIHLVKDPADIVPGDPDGKFNTEPIAPSGMPPFLLAEEDANALTAYILGLNRKGIPPQFLKMRAPEQTPIPNSSIEHGRWVYDEFGCAACHGPDARGGVRNFNYQYDVTPNLRRAVATYSREELKAKISDGVAFLAKHNPNGANPPLYMPPWKSKIKGQNLEDLVSYLTSLREE